MQQGAPPTRIQIGEPHKKQKTMNDEIVLVQQGGLHKINAIKVISNDKYIIGLMMYYKLADGDYLKAGHNIPKEKKMLKKSNKIKQRVFEIGPDDYLLEIAGHYDEKEKHIARLTFTSYRGKIGNYGSDLGTPFKYKFDNYTFGPISSGYKDYIDFLDMPVMPVPQNFLQELKPVTVNVNISEMTQRTKDVQYKNLSQSQQWLPNNGNNQQGGFQGGQSQQIYGSQPQPQTQQKPQFQGVYVSQNQGSKPQVGSVIMPTIQIPTNVKPVQQQPFQQQQPQYQQQPFQQQPQYQQQPFQQQQQQPFQQQQQQFNMNQKPQGTSQPASNNPSVTKSNYPEF